MKEDVDLEEQIDRCRRLAKFLTDDEMRQALEALAEDYEARLKQRKAERSSRFMLRDRH